MDFETTAKLRQEWTGKAVVLSASTARLARFVGRTGHVKTINQNGMALVQFEGSEDIGWYDISPELLRIVDQPASESA